jgi:hypothetical protein
MQFNRVILASMSLCVLTAVAGCAGEEQASVFPVSGKVTYRGKPLDTGRVVFNPLGNGLELAEGDIQPDGSYRLKTESGAEGAAPGEYKVTVHAFTPGVGEEGVDANYKPPKPLVPSKYLSMDASPLSKTVEKKENVIDLALTD